MWRRLADWCVPARALAWGTLTTSSGSHASFRVNQHVGTVVWLHPDDHLEPTLAEVAAGEQIAQLIGAPRWRIRWRPGRQDR